MRVEAKICQAIAAINRLENSGRRMNARQRRRCCYWIDHHSRLEWKKQRAFRNELWGSIFAALESGKVQSLTVLANTPVSDAKRSL